MIRWEYRRDPPRADYPYARGHVHVNGTLFNGEPAAHLHVPAPKMPLELIVRHLITEWDVKPRTKDWEAILEDSAAGFDTKSH